MQPPQTKETNVSERITERVPNAPRSSSRWARSFRVRVLATTAISVLALMATGVAGACNGTIQQGNYSVAGNTWLKAFYNREYDDNNAFINQTWSVCEKLIAPNSSPEFRYSYKCATNGFAYGFSNDLGNAPYPNCNTVMSALMLNNQGSSATFNFYQHY
jgi:hypothetical protein